jgi:hypothetical protein
VVLVIARPFPEPPPAVRDALTTLEILRGGDPDRVEDLGDVDDLPRPWNPAACPAELRYEVWQWCDEVADWINHEYAWRPSLMIPSCWPRHPHIAQELPALACLRYAAALAYGAELLEDWHRYALPTFLERMTGRLGESNCRNGKHTDWPAKPRHQAQTTADAGQERLDLFYADVDPPIALPVGGRR